MRPWMSLVPSLRGPMKVRFTLSMALSGPVYAVMQFGEVIARKSLGASALTITLLTMVNPVLNLTAIWWSRIIEGRDQRKLLLVTGLVGQAALMSGFWLVHLPHLLMIYLFFNLSYTLWVTAQNRLLQQHIESDTLGSLFGFANGLRALVAAVVSYFAGHWMDHHPTGYQQVYLLTGLVGLLGTVLFATMPTRVDPDHVIYRPNLKNLLSPLIEAGRLLKRRPDYLRFEVGFMMYGIAFMMMLPVVPIFLVDDLKLDYTVIGLARGAVFQVVTILSIAWFGRLFDRMTPHALAARVFGLLALFPLLLIVSQFFPLIRLPAVYTAFALFGLAMGGVSVLWSISSVRFAGNEDAGVYQALHVAATAVRGSIGPPLSYLVMTTLGRPYAMAMATFFWLLAGATMAWLDRTDGRAMAPMPPLG